MRTRAKADLSRTLKSYPLRRRRIVGKVYANHLQWGDDMCSPFDKQDSYMLVTSLHYASTMQSTVVS